MARESFQNEVPPARVNIRYVKDTDGAKEEIELPHRVLMIGDFTQRDDDTELEDLDKIRIDKDRFDKVMESMNLELKYDVRDRLSKDEDAEMRVELEFKNLKDFQPESVVKKIPKLDAMLKVRELLKDLKARVINNKQFRKELEQVLLDKGMTDELKAELVKITPKEE